MFQLIDTFHATISRRAQLHVASGDAASDHANSATKFGLPVRVGAEERHRNESRRHRGARWRERPRGMVPLPITITGAFSFSTATSLRYVFALIAGGGRITPPSCALPAPPLPANAPRRSPVVNRKALVEGRERYSVANAKSLPSPWTGVRMVRHSSPKFHSPSSPSSHSLQPLRANPHSPRYSVPEMGSLVRGRGRRSVGGNSSSAARSAPPAPIPIATAPPSPHRGGPAPPLRGLGKLIHDGRE
jgi:hypothetical protein